MNNTEQKRKSLEILVKHSYFLSEPEKQKLLEKMPELDEKTVDAIGKFLALEKKKALEFTESLSEEN